MRARLITAWLVLLAVMVALALLLTGCAGGPRVSMSFPIGEAGKYGAIELAIGYTPPPALYTLATAPSGLGLRDFKTVVNARR